MPSTRWSPRTCRLPTASVDFDHLRRCCTLKLFLSATNVRSGKIKVFENAEITADVEMTYL